MIRAELSRFERRLLSRLLANPTRLRALQQQPGYAGYLRDLIARQQRELMVAVQNALCGAPSPASAG